MSSTETERVVSVTERGQATIPREFREGLGIDAPGRVTFVRPIRSATDLRGILRGETDEQGRSATERLRDERERDRAAVEELRERHTTDESAE